MILTCLNDLNVKLEYAVKSLCIHINQIATSFFAIFTPHGLLPFPNFRKVKISFFEPIDLLKSSVNIYEHDFQHDTARLHGQNTNLVA